MKQYLFQPFLRIAGYTSCFWGLAGLLLTAAIAYFSNCHFDGALDAHLGRGSAFWVYVFEFLLDWSCMFVFLYIGGRLVSKSKIRVIDVAGTSLLARWPMALVAIAAFALRGSALPITQLSSGLIIFAIVALLSIIWMIALLFQAFSISCHAKGSKAIIAFIFALVFSEVFSKIIMLQLAPSIY